MQGTWWPTAPMSHGLAMRFTDDIIEVKEEEGARDPLNKPPS